MSVIDLSTMPAPSLIRPLDPEPEIAAFIDKLKTEMPDWRGVFESDPFVKVCQSWTVRLMLEQVRHNQDARSILLAYAKGADLDHIAATYYAFAGVERATGEGDESFRRRIQLAPEAYSSAGSIGGYLFHALSVDPVAIVDADVWFPAPGHANVAIQPKHDADAVAASRLVEQVDRRLREPKLRTSDILSVSLVQRLDATVVATLDVPFGPDGAMVETEARRRFGLLQAYVEKPRRILTLTAIASALHASNVTRVRLSSPTADIVPAPGQRVRISTFALTTERTNG